MHGNAVLRFMRCTCLHGLVGLALIAAGCKKQTQQVRVPASSGGEIRAYNGPMEPDDGQWIRATKDYANTRYSTLNQINTENVTALKVAWTFDTGIARGQEAAPIVANNTMYVMSPWPNKLYALDLTKPHGLLKWTFEPNPSPAAKGEACCDWVNRGAVFTDGKVICNTLDGYTIAVDANTGKLLWRTHLADITKGETMTMAPIAVRDKVYVGNSGGEFGVRGWLAALDTKSWQGTVAGLQRRTGQRRSDRRPVQAVLSAVQGHGFGCEDLAA